ncbi:hypothetical protein [Pseudarthrobacter cellobiosi]|uniref:hypothetical protein n=1 Tax=Pseudarthrobacter cellobiosi TaxID=2953654 RepID=UPI00208F6D4E|nr:hypothetical protein [Pseudarthrobacter sp. HLT1-5]MCO4257342.1 hypothetical protein [Pseudarthrobacter sp. HLT1-5]
MIPAEAVEAAVPWITNFLERRGLSLRGKEAEALAGYILTAAAPHMLAAAQSAALEEVADLIEPFSGIGLAHGATRGDVARWLRDRAATYRPAE